jgi:Fe-S cluster assembly ATP-binding protein
MLEIKNLLYEVNGENGPVDILKNINLTIEDNKFVAITGPNGGGKTTLAKAIMGIVKPTGGQIIYNGIDVTNMGITERARLGISYAFQQPPRFKGLRVKDIMDISAGRGLTLDESCQYLTQVGLCSNSYLDREVDASLSGGEVKRIEIASILARKSQLMIFDEPEAGIDLWSFSRLIDTFKDIHKRKDATLLLISHQERIISIADEIILVGDGELKMFGPGKEVFPHILENTCTGCCYMEDVTA